MGSVVRGVHVGTDLVAGECLFYFTDSRDQNVEFCVTHVMHVASKIHSARPLANFWHGLHGSGPHLTNSAPSSWPPGT